MAELWAYISERGLGELSRDALDVLVTYYIIYRVSLVLRGTRAMQVGVGLGVVFVLYAVAQLLGLTTLVTILNSVISSALLIVVVVFQNDIRRGLMRVGSGAWFGSKRSQEAHVIDEVVEAATELARNRTGAIIAIEQDANLDEFVGANKGHEVDAAVGRELLVALFVPEAMNKLHDGAVIIRNFRIAKAGVFFPMPDRKVMDASFGSRHRAAFGISEETDAVVVVVSEERGSISFIFNGNIVSNLDGPKLRAALGGIFAPATTKSKKKSRTRSPDSRQSVAVATPVVVEERQSATEVETEEDEVTGTPLPTSERPSTLPRAPSDDEDRPTSVSVPSEHPAPLRKVKADPIEVEGHVAARASRTSSTSKPNQPAKTPMRASTLPATSLPGSEPKPGTKSIESEKERGTN